MNKFFHSIFIFIITLPSAMAVSGSAIYVLYGFDKISIFLTALISLIISGLVIKLEFKNYQAENLYNNLRAISRKDWLLFILFLINFIIGFYLLYKGQSDRALITPWQVVNSWFFITYAVGIALMFLLARLSSKLLTPVLIGQSLLLFGVAAIIYRLGYGFDSFVHEAAVRAIEQLGQIKPITPYYLGQYSIMILLHNLTTIDLAFWSKILVPSLTCLTLPLIIMRWLKHHHGTEKDWALAAVMLFVLPASIFIVTTPQSLAYLFLLIVIFWPSKKSSLAEKIIIWLAALASLLTQPVAGIPAILLALANTTENKKIDKIIYPLIIIGFVLALPAAFYVFTALNPATIASLTWPNLNFLSNLLPTNPNQQVWWLNFIYFYDGLWGLIILALTAFGIRLSFVKSADSETNHFELRRRFAWPALALILASIITSMINFHFLIDYERSDYPLRLIIVALIFALPLIINGLRQIAKLIEKSNNLIKPSWLIIIIGATTASLYLSYPRFDYYHNSHGYASSKADSLATIWIEEDSHNEPYVVLANQQVSAAALRNYGFKNYYQNNIFYYPVPTGGELYQKYLLMIEKPNLETIKQAQNLTGVKLVYFVLDSYWWDYKTLVSETSLLTKNIQDIGDGQVMIFKFGK